MNKAYKYVLFTLTTFALISILVYATTIISNTAISTTKVNNVFYAIADNSSSIQDAIDSCPSTGCSVYVPAGTYIMTESIIPKSNSRIKFDDAAIIIRSPTFKTSSDDNLVTLSNENIILEGGQFSGNNVTASGSLHFAPIYVSGHNIIVRDVTVYDLGTASGDGDDSCVLVADPARIVRIESSYCRDNHYSHGYQFFGEQVVVSNCVAENIAQDGFRTYQGTRDMVIQNSIAKNTRVGFQAWSAGERDITFIGTVAVNSEHYGYLFSGIGGTCIGCRSVNATNLSLKIVGNMNSIYGFFANGTTIQNVSIEVSGNNNYLTQIMGETNNYYGINNTGASNSFFQVRLSGTTDPISSTGTNPFYLNIDGESPSIGSERFLSLNITAGNFLDLSGGKIRYNTGSSAIEMAIGTTSKFMIFSTYLDAKSQNLYNVKAMNMTSNFTMLNASAGMKVANLSGTGNDYVCVDANGVFYRSDSVCA